MKKTKVPPVPEGAEAANTEVVELGMAGAVAAAVSAGAVTAEAADSMAVTAVEAKTEAGAAEEKPGPAAGYTAAGGQIHAQEQAMAVCRSSLVRPSIAPFPTFSESKSFHPPGPASRHHTAASGNSRAILAHWVNPTLLS